MNQNSHFEDEGLLPPVRSTFLTVLCVLTFLGSAMGIFKGISSIFTADTIYAATQKSMNEADHEKAKKELSKKDEPGSKFALKMMNAVKDMNPEKIKQSGISTAIASMITLLGAILMWRLNKRGFYIYIIGIVATVAIPFFVFGSDNIFASIGAIVPAFFGVIFIAMYAFNLKDMK